MVTLLFISLGLTVIHFSSGNIFPLRRAGRVEVDD